MRKARFYLTARDAKRGCKKTLNLPEQVSPQIVNVPAGIQDKENIFVHGISFVLENGKTSIEPVQITICINQNWKSFHTFKAPFLFLLSSFVLLAVMIVICPHLLVVAEILYKVEPYYMFGAGFVVSPLLWIIPAPQKFKSHTTYLTFAAVSLLFILGGLALYVRSIYTYIPTVKLYRESLISVSSKFQDSGLQISDDNYVFDELANRKKEEGEDPFGYFFKVFKIIPTSDTFVHKDIFVELHVTWNNDVTSISISPASTAQTSAQEIYGGINTDFIYPYNADTFTLFTGIAAAKMSIDGFGEILLSKSPIKRTPLEVRLINFDTGKQIDAQAAYLGDKITFANIPDGIYYYVISCDGYLAAIPDHPFKLRRDSGSEAGILSWSADLEKEGTLLSQAFSIRIQDIDGRPICNSEVNIRAVGMDNPSPNSFSCQPLYSDENGYLTYWYNVNNQDFYGLVSFQLFSDCYLEVRLGEEGDFSYVQIDGELGICTIT